ncbi:MAG: ribosome-associated translation inhibitor RaiA [Pseudomonadaceae bacterium]|nr:ribosome-associated translation inhibitor RaiA [Pseudomonadaceae bacterium]
MPNTRITITGQHMDTGEALQEHTREKLEGVKKYFEQIHDVNVTFVHDQHHAHHFLAELTVHASGVMLRAEGGGDTAYVALDEAYKKLQRQLDKYKGRLQKHRERRRKFGEQLKAMTPISFEDAAVEESQLDGVDTDAFADFAPTIIRKDVGQIEPMSVDEAVMQMDLLHKPAFLFLNAKSGKLNMVYRDGGETVRWVAPK